MEKPTIEYHHHDLPSDRAFGEKVAIDTEAMGLNITRDRLCVIQLSMGDGVCHIIKMGRQISRETSPRICAMLEDPNIQKIFHFARFDVALLAFSFGLDIKNIYCTKIASKLSRTYTERHGLKDLCRDILGKEISKTSQSSDWGQAKLTKEQGLYAAYDVFYLHALQEKLDEILMREERMDLARKCFEMVLNMARIDLLGFSSTYIFEH